MILCQSTCCVIFINWNAVVGRSRHSTTNQIRNAHKVELFCLTGFERYRTWRRLNKFVSVLVSYLSKYKPWDMSNGQYAIGPLAMRWFTSFFLINWKISQLHIHRCSVKLLIFIISIVNGLFPSKLQLKSHKDSLWPKRYRFGSIKFSSSHILILILIQSKVE